MELFYSLYLLGSFLILSPAQGQKIKSAVAVIQGDGGKGPTVGSLTFTSIEGGKVRIQGTVTGLKRSPSGLHGFHIHEFGDQSDGCLSAGSHFNPTRQTHRDIRDHERHVGDLGNVQVNERGEAHVDLVDDMIVLNGAWSIIGRSIVIHGGEDDLGRGGNSESKKNGNSGARVACGVIGRRSSSAPRLAPVKG